MQGKLILVCSILALAVTAYKVEIPNNAVEVFKPSGSTPLVKGFGYHNYWGTENWGMRMSFTVDAMLGYRFPLKYFT